VGGAHGMRLIVPPSWSVAISSGGRPPAFAAAWSVASSFATCAGEITFEPNRMTPPIWPARMRASRLALGVVPVIRTMSFCPMSWASVGAAVDVVAGGGVAGGRVGCSGTWLGAGDFDGTGEGDVSGSVGAPAVALGCALGRADGPAGAAQPARITTTNTETSLRTPDRCRRAPHCVGDQEIRTIASLASVSVGKSHGGKGALGKWLSLRRARAPYEPIRSSSSKRSTIVSKCSTLASMRCG
jgi:hypothetical protein